MRVSLTILSSLLILAYPLIVFLGLRVVPVSFIGAFLILLALLRLTFVPSATRGGAVFVAIPVIVVLTGLHALLTGSEKGLLFYPAIVNLVLLGVFGASLLQRQTVVERLARLREPGLPASGVVYTRKVTVAWCGFFALNGAAALYTALYASREMWALYNGLLAYLLMGALFAGEWLLRRHLLRSSGVQAG